MICPEVWSHEILRIIEKALLCHILDCPVWIRIYLPSNSCHSLWQWFCILEYSFPLGQNSLAYHCWLCIPLIIFIQQFESQNLHFICHKPLIQRGMKPLRNLQVWGVDCCNELKLVPHDLQNSGKIKEPGFTRQTLSLETRTVSQHSEILYPVCYFISYLQEHCISWNLQSWEIDYKHNVYSDAVVNCIFMFSPDCGSIWRPAGGGMSPELSAIELNIASAYGMLPKPTHTQIFRVVYAYVNPFYLWKLSNELCFI